MHYYFSIFKTNIYIVISPISNNSSFHSTVHHTSFTKTVFCGSFDVLIGNFAFFKLVILPMYCHSPIFETNIDVVTSTVSNNSSFHTTIHHSSFAKAVFGRNFGVWMSNVTFFKWTIRFMFCYFSIFKTNIYIITSTISNNCSFHSAVHHSCFAKTDFAKSIYFCCHKLPLAFLHLLLHCCYKILFVLPMF